VGGSHGSTGKRPGGFFLKCKRGKKDLGKVFRSPERRKALKGEAHERWELKETSKGLGDESHREGSQTLGVELLGGRVKVFQTHSERDVARRVPGSGYAEGPESSGKVLETSIYGRHRYRFWAANGEARRPRWRGSVREERFEAEKNRPEAPGNRRPEGPRKKGRTGRK
jgi:hypothetical protein